MPLRSHGSLSLDWALIAARRVDRLQGDDGPVITQSGLDPIFRGAADFDLDLDERRTLGVTAKTHSPLTAVRRPRVL